MLLAVTAVSGAALAWLPDPIVVDLGRAELGSLLVSVEEDGRTRVKDRYVVSAPLLANAARLELTAGDDVQPGQVLARLVPLEPPLLDARTQAQSEARLAATLAGERQAAASIERVRASYEYARSEAARQRTLSEQGASADSTLRRAQLEERTLHEELTSALFAAKVASYEVAMAKLALDRQQRRGAAAEQIEILSPVGGQVLKVLQESGGVVQPGAPLLELGDVHALEIVADVLTSDAVHVREGAPVSIERWGGDPLQARVRRIEPSAFTRLSALGVEEQRVNVIIDLDDIRTHWITLGDGYRVEARIEVTRLPRVLRIPASAVFRQGQSWAAFTVADGRAHLAALELGARNADHAEVRSGLQAGARVVIHPSDRLSDGARIEPNR
jgi:HlyD family secretion protein